MQEPTCATCSAKWRGLQANWSLHLHRNSPRSVFKILQVSSELIPFIGERSENISSAFFTESLISLAGNTGVYAIWNTTAGGNSLTSSPGFSTGRYWYSQNVTNVFDGLWDTFYCGYGQCNVSFPDVSCGQNTGLYVTLQHGPFILSAFRMVKGNFSSTRDPMRITIEGSNQNGMNLTFGSSWTPLYNGTAGLDINPGFRNAGVKQSLVNNQLRFSSYRFLILAKRGNETCTEYAEIELFGY